MPAKKKPHNASIPAKKVLPYPENRLSSNEMQLVRKQLLTLAHSEFFVFKGHEAIDLAMMQIPNMIKHRDGSTGLPGLLDKNL